MKTIAIIGSSGTNARPWTDAFLKAGWHIRSLVRDPRKIESRPHLTATAFDFSDPQSLTKRPECQSIQSEAIGTLASIDRPGAFVSRARL